MVDTDLSTAARAFLAAWDAAGLPDADSELAWAVADLRAALAATETAGGFCPDCPAGRQRQGVLVWRDVRLARCQTHATAADWAAGRAEVERRRRASRAGR